MLYENKLEIHNAEALIPGKVGTGLCRMPLAVRAEMLEPVPEITCDWTGVELRFVITEGNSATVSVWCPAEEAELSRSCHLAYGSHQGGWLWLNSRQLVPGMNEITVTLPENLERLAELSREYAHPFDVRVMRLIFSSAACELCGASDNIRPPRPEELPRRYGIFYGSSITHGSLSMTPISNYVALMGKALGVDTWNKGMAGSCYVEPAVSDYLISRTDAAFISVEVGTNCAENLTEEELRRRVEYLVKGFAADPGERHLFLVDCLGIGDHYECCRLICRKAVEHTGCPRIHYVSGLSLLPNRSFLSADQVHPSVEGHISIAQRYTQIVRSYL